MRPPAVFQQKLLWHQKLRHSLESRLGARLHLHLPRRSAVQNSHELNLRRLKILGTAKPPVDGFFGMAAIWRDGDSGSKVSLQLFAHVRQHLAEPHSRLCGPSPLASSPSLLLVTPRNRQQYDVRLFVSGGLCVRRLGGGRTSFPRAGDRRQAQARKARTKQRASERLPQPWVNSSHQSLCSSHQVTVGVD